MPFPELAAAPHFARQPLGIPSGGTVWAVLFPYSNLFLVFHSDDLHCSGQLVEGTGFPRAMGEDLVFWAAGGVIVDNHLEVLAQGGSKHRLRTLDRYSLKDCSYTNSVLLPRYVSSIAHDDGVYWFGYEEPVPTLIGLRLRRQSD